MGASTQILIERLGEPSMDDDQWQKMNEICDDVVRKARNFGLDSYQCEDLRQDVKTAIVQVRQKFNPRCGSSLRAWIRGIANICAKRVRSRVRGIGGTTNLQIICNQAERGQDFPSEINETELAEEWLPSVLELPGAPGGAKVAEWLPRVLALTSAPGGAKIIGELGNLLSGLVALACSAPDESKVMAGLEELLPPLLALAWSEDEKHTALIAKALAAFPFDRRLNLLLRFALAATETHYGKDVFQRVRNGKTPEKSWAFYLLFHVARQRATKIQDLFPDTERDAIFQDARRVRRRLESNDPREVV